MNTPQDNPDKRMGVFSYSLLVSADDPGTKRLQLVTHFEILLSTNDIDHPEQASAKNQKKKRLERIAPSRFSTCSMNLSFSTVFRHRYG